MPEPSHAEEQIRSEQSRYEKMLQECLRGELRVVNAGLPRHQERLSDLLGSEYPHAICSDGSTLFFKKKELRYLTGITDPAEQKALLLPILIEVGAGEGEASVVCQSDVEGKVVSRVLDMPLTCEEGRIRIYRPQLAVLRSRLKTTTAYVFSARSVA
jgi:uncharacterized protein (UPF0216 family)